MNRKLIIPALLACVMQACAVYAQTLSVPPLTPQGQPIVARIDGLPDGARVAWKASPGASVINGGKGKAYLWGSASHSVSAVIALADADADLLWLEASFVVGDAPPTPPPVVQTLAQLAGDKAAALSAMYAEFSTALEGGLFDDVAHFRRTEAAGLTGRKLAGHGATAAIAKRLDVGSLDELQAAVALVVEELGSPAPGPVAPDDPNATPVSFDGFHVVFLYESNTRPTWLFELLESPAVDAYLASHCEGGANGWRKWDQNVTLTNAPPNLKELAALPKPSIPAVAISFNKQAVVLPLGKQTEAELLALLKKYGGA